MELEYGDESTLINYGIRSGEWEAIVFGDRFPEFWKVYKIRSFLRLHDRVHRINGCEIADFLGEEYGRDGKRRGLDVSPRRKEGYLTLMEKLTITSIEDLPGVINEVELTRNGKRVIFRTTEIVDN